SPYHPATVVGPCDEGDSTGPIEDRRWRCGVDWHRGPGTGEDAAAGVAQLLARAQEELGGPLLGARFLYDARQMFAATREIERAVSAPGSTLYVGFQRAEKLDGEAPIYRDLTGPGPALSPTTRGWSGRLPATSTAWLIGRRPQPRMVR